MVTLNYTKPLEKYHQKKSRSTQQQCTTQEIIHFSHKCYAEICLKPIQKTFFFFDCFTTMVQSNKALNRTQQYIKNYRMLDS